MADDSEQIGQDEIENLLKQAQSGAPPPPPAEEAAASEEEAAALDQNEIEALFGGGGSPQEPAPAAAEPTAQPTASTAAPPASPPPPAAAAAASAGAAQTEAVAGQGDIDFLLNQAEQALASIDQPQTQNPPNVDHFKFKDFSGTPPSSESATLELVRDVELDLKIELGRTHMQLEDVLQLRKGSVVPLDKLAGDPVDIYVNGRLIARGEVLVLNDNFCVRVAELMVGESAVA